MNEGMLRPLDLHFWSISFQTVIWGLGDLGLKICISSALVLMWASTHAWHRVFFFHSQFGKWLFILLCLKSYLVNLATLPGYWGQMPTCFPASYQLPVLTVFHPLPAPLSPGLWWSFGHFPENYCLLPGPCFWAFWPSRSIHHSFLDLPSDSWLLAFLFAAHHCLL